VQIEEGIDALLHVSDLSWTQKVNHPSEVLEKGQEIEVKILSIDPAHEKISVGFKQLQIDPWQRLMNELKVGADVEVEIAKLVSFGAFARLAGGIEGLIHVSEIGRDVQKPEDVLNVGDKVTARVISIDPVERKIGLSIRAFKENEEVKLREEFGKSGSDTPVSVRDAVGDTVPASLLSAGGTLADAANELMAAVRSGPEAKRRKSAVKSEEGGVVEPPAPPDAPEEPESGS
jgi:small subunit ribosomal protein S1